MSLYFTPAHHAMLFACLTRALHQAFGPSGLEAAAGAVRCYGEQRGRRMAARTRSDGLEPDAAGYLAYGEWSAEPGPTQSSLPSLWPEVVMENRKCPWYDLWRQKGLLEYGGIYCREVDAALARGYCGMTLDTVQCLTRGDALCRFVFRGQGVGPERQAELQKRQAALGDSAQMPWSYHCAHLYAAFLHAARLRLGLEGAAACALALEDFGEEYGPEMAAFVLRRAADDFEAVARKEEY